MVIVMQADEEFTADSAIKKLKVLANELEQQKCLAEYELDYAKGIKLILKRTGGRFEFAIYIYDGEEVFSRKINNAYETFETAYSSDDKAAKLDELISEAKQFMTENNFHEEVYELNGIVIFRNLIFSDGTHESSSPVFLGRLKRFFGAKKIILKPV